MTATDFDVSDFARMLRELPDAPKISKAFEEADPQKKRWWTSQRQHMTEWFASQPELEFRGYKRQKPNHSARTTYARLRHAEALVWMAEALGVDPVLVQEAADRASALPRAQRCAFLRNNYFSWTVIAEHVTASQARIT